MKMFSRKHDIPQRENTTPTFWPQDRIDDVDDAAFARAIAEGRIAEQRQLVA
jgi:hypothetical protein